MSFPTAKNSLLLPRTLASLAECDQPANYRRTIVVENGTRGTAEGTTHCAPSVLGAEYLHVERANKSNALNCVLERLDDDTLVYLVDDDVRFAKNVLIEYSRASSDLTAGVVLGGPLRIDSESDPPDRWLPLLPGSMKGWEPTQQEFDASRKFFLGANWAVFVGDVKRAGGFDSRYGPGSRLGATGQEWNMQIALKQLGARFEYLPGAVVWHHVDFGRFSPDFLLRRKFRGGLEAGIRAADHMKYSPRVKDLLLRPLMRARWRFLKHAAAAAFYKTLGQGATEFEQRLEAEHAKGFLCSYPRAMCDEA